MGSQQGCSGGSLDAWAFDRANMLNGTFVNPVRFTIAGPALFLLPVDLDGATNPPLGAPAPFARAIDGTLWGGADRVEVFDFHVDWNNPALSTFTPNVTLATNFDANMCNGQNLFNNCVPQPGTATLLETLTNWSMQPLQYRNFGLATPWSSPTRSTRTGATTRASAGTSCGAPPRAPVRGRCSRGNSCAERRPPVDGQRSPNGAGDMAVGYSASDGTSVFPGIRYAGRLSTDPINTLPQGEFTMVNGATSSGATRWGDYSAMAVDPVDDCTFWYTAEYMANVGGGRASAPSSSPPACGRSRSTTSR